MTPEEQQDLFALRQQFVRYRFHFLGIMAMGAILGGTVAHFSPTLFTSRAIIFPANTTNPALAGGSSPFGLEMHADQLIEILYSQALMDSLLKKTNWKKFHPHIVHPSDQIHALRSQLEFRHTHHLSIVLSATTPSDSLSQSLLKVLLEDAPAVYQNILQSNVVPVYKKMKNNLVEIQARIDSLQVFEPQADSFLNQQRKSLLTSSQTQWKNTQQQTETLHHRLERSVHPLYVIQPPHLPTQPSHPSYLQFMLIGIAIAAFGFVLVILFRFFYF